MDMLPPQAPPAHVTHANQSAVDSLQRMRTTQAWLVEQQAALPDLPATLDAPDLFLDALDAFWEAPVGHTPGLPAIPRRQALALRLAEAARDDAALRNNDGTFAAESLALVRAVALHPGGPLPGHLHASELLAGTRLRAGALVLENDREPDRVLLFTVEAGWQAFDSLEALYRDAKQAMRRQLAQEELPDIDLGEMGIRAIDGDVFDTLTRRVIARLRQRVVQVWAHASSDESQDALRAALDLHALLDMHGIVQQRDLALAATRDEDRLAIQPAAVRDHWRSMASAYRDTVYGAHDTHAASFLSLEDFTADALATALHVRGIAVPPRELRVRLSRRTLENGPLNTALSGFAQEELSLLELAYRNIGITDGMEVIHADGSPRSDVSVEVLRQIVRDLDLPHRYARYLDETHGDSPAGRQRRGTLTSLLKARMGFEAADARLSYYDDREPRSFRSDLYTDPSPKPPHASGRSRNDHGFQSVRTVLDHPHPQGRKRVDNQEIGVYQLTYEGEPVTEVFMIAARGKEAAPQVVLYTPGAPDGIAFREFANRDALARDFLLQRRFERYLLDRLPREFGEPDPKSRSGGRRFKVTRLNDDRTLGWVFPFLASCEKCTALSSDFVEREVTTNFLDVAYADTIALARRNASDATRSTAATDAGAAWDVFWNWNLPVQLVREFVVGAAKSIPRTAQAAWRFYDHVKAGESTEAFLAFVDGYTAALNVLPLYTQVPRIAGAYVRAGGSRALVPSQHSLPAPDTLFAKKYLARDVAAPAVEPASGVFHVTELAGVRRGVVRQDGKLYHVRFDKTHDCWRLDEPHNPASYGPPIERATGGHWHYRRVGLRGGNPFEDLLEVQQMLADGTALSPDVAALTEPQRIMLISTLNGKLSFNDFAVTLRTKVSRWNSVIRLPQAHEQAWNDALRIARATSGEASASTLPQALGLPEQPSSSQPGPSRVASTASTTERTVDTAGAAGVPSSAQPALLGAGWSSTAPPPVWTRTFSRYQRVAQFNWPTHAYVYLFPDDLAQMPGSNGIAFRQFQNGNNVLGVPLITLPPDTPMYKVPRSLRHLLPQHTGTPSGTLGDASSGWVRISLEDLPFRRSANAAHRYQLHRVPWVPYAFYLRVTESTPGKSGWSLSSEPLHLTKDQYVLKLPRR